MNNDHLLSRELKEMSEALGTFITSPECLSSDTLSSFQKHIDLLADLALSQEEEVKAIKGMFQNKELLESIQENLTPEVVREIYQGMVDKSGGMQ